MDGWTAIAAAMLIYICRGLCVSTSVQRTKYH